MDLRLRATRISSVVLLSCCGLCGIAVAEKPRFHILTPDLTERLVKHTPKLHSTMAVVGLYRRKEGRSGGTAFLLHTGRTNETAQVMTAHHVALFERDSVAGDSVLFYPNGAGTEPVEAPVLRVLKSDQSIDYALLEVELPAAMREVVGVRVRPSRPRPLEEGQRLYNPSFPRIWKDEKLAKFSRLVSGSPCRDVYKSALAGATTPKMMQVGSAQGFSVQGFEVASLPQQNGSSGSPVFDSFTHRFVGMLTAGGGLDTAMIRPASEIAADLAATPEAPRPTTTTPRR